VKLYRVFPWDENAAADQPGGALFSPPGGSGRFDNPELYRRLYCSRTAEAAVGDRLGVFARWRPEHLCEGNFRLSLATLDVPDQPLADLDLVQTLVVNEIDRVTKIVARDRSVTQPIAARIFELSLYAGLVWWSVYYPDWSNVMLWSNAGVSLASEPEPLSIGHRAVAEASSLMRRPILKR
jgi:hypothetical protein